MCYVADVASKLQIHSLASGSKQREVTLPGIGSVTQFAGKREDSEFFFGFSSFTEPGATYRYALHDGLTPNDVHFSRNFVALSVC